MSKPKIFTWGGSDSGASIFKAATGQGSTFSVVNTSLSAVSRKIESPDYADEFFVDKSRFIPSVDFQDPANFARFGSAEQYYIKAIENIYRFYPYDGSKKEKLEWHNQSSFFDNYIFEYEYPRTNGNLQIGQTWGTVSTTKTVGTDIYKVSDAPQYVSIKGGPHAASIPAYASSSYSKKLSFKESEQKANVYDSTTKQMQNFTIDGTVGNTVEFWLKLPTYPSASQTSPSHAYFDLWNGETILGVDYGRFLVESRYETSTGTPTGEYLNDTFFNVTYMSGTTGVRRAAIGAKALTSSLGIDLADWNHIAMSVENSSTTASDPLEIKLYVNGDLIETTLTGTIVQPVTTGSYNALLGAYKTAPESVSNTSGVAEGYGSLTGSYFDEFRYWTIKRESDAIAFNWFKQIDGGTNTDYGKQTSKFYKDINPVNLGVYYKFNEGITQTSSIDRVTLDYSGRVSNGYIANYTEAMRSTGSAIVEKGVAAREFKDPIVYNFHPSVLGYYNSSSYKGREYDGRNSMYLFNMLPNWIIDDDEYKGKNQVLYLNQIIASYFDNLYLQIQSVPRLKDPSYVSGSASGSLNKPLPFADKLLSNTGFTVPEIFGNANVFESLASRDDDREFDRKLSDVKNQIYSNIYNNLLYINKTKGTIKSITNMMRCFGVDDDLYSINFYANNAELDLKSSTLPRSIRKSYADFNHIDRFGATVFQMTGSGNSNSISFVTGSNDGVAGWDSENGFTVETEVIFPRSPSYGDVSYENYNFMDQSASLFGMHQAKVNAGIGSETGVTTWNTDDYANFQVYAVKEKANNLESESKNVRFILTSSNPNSATLGIIPEISSSIFKEVYNNERWNLSVRVYPTKYPNIGYISGSESTEYTVEFAGYNLIGDTVQNSFNLTSSIAEADGINILTANKRVYIGSHRENFTGSLLASTNVKASSCRYWAVPLSNEELISHALDPRNYGVYNAMQNTFLLQDKGGYKVEVPKIKTLVMNWDFDNITGSDTGQYGGEFSVEDFSSGSGDDRYGEYLSDLIEKQHTARGAYFASGNNETGSISREYVRANRQQVPENLNNDDAVRVLSRDDEFFTKRTKPVTFSFSVEKNMYQSISEEMLNFIAASKEASALEEIIGDPVNKYRGRYKKLEKIRNIFFERVGNIPDVDKYMEYFKWLDTSISQMIAQIIPASSAFSSVRNVIESHIFERSGKYKHKFPTIKQIYPKQIKVSELQNKYMYYSVQSEEGVYEAAATSPIGSQSGFSVGSNTSISSKKSKSWQHNHAFIKDQGDLPEPVESASWWKNRVPFSADTAKTTEDTETDNSFNRTLEPATHPADGGNIAALSEASGNPITMGSSDEAFSLVVDSGGMAGGFNDQNKSRPKKDRNFRNVVFNESPAGSGKKISFNTSTMERQPNTLTLDKIDPNRKFKPEFKIEIPSVSTEKGFDGRRYSPLSFQSSSTDNPEITGSTPWHIGYEMSTQHLQDYYLDNKDIPMQGPFTQQNVGGYSYRHAGLNIGVASTRQEAWYAYKTITANPDGIQFDFYNLFDLNKHAPRNTLMRGEFAKRPLNIRNIKSTTSSAGSNPAYPPINELGSAKIYNGNYSKDYQVVQIPGRDINNRYFIDNNGISTTSTANTGAPSVSGIYDRTIPDRGKNESIMVSRFSAPGGPDVNGQAFLNYESEVFSPYNALPFRNLAVRQPLSTLLTRHTAFGGYDSELGSPSASYEKIQRNGRKYIQYTDIFETATTGTVYDNSHVQHQIPQSDSQYAWITASATETPLGYSQKDYANASLASTDITFVSASEFGMFINTSVLPSGKYIFGKPNYAAGGLFIPQDFVGLNTFSYADADELDNNTVSHNNNAPDGLIGVTIVAGALGAARPPQSLHLSLLKGNGPYGHPSWRQIRNSYHPVVKYMRGINRFSILTEKTSISPGDAKLQKITTQTLENFTEPMVSFKYKPIEHDLFLKDGSTIEIDSVYSNELGTFTNNKIDDLLDYDKDRDDPNLAYNILKKIYIDKLIPLAGNPIDSLGELKYREVVYPRERNTALAKTRGRENYTVSSGSDNFNRVLGESTAFWKNNIDDRLRTDAAAKNSSGAIIASGSSYFGITDMSIWPLDSEEPLYDLYARSSSVGSATPNYWSPLSPSASTLDPDSEPRFNSVMKNGELSYGGWLYSLLGMNIMGRLRSNGEATGSAPLPNYGTEQGYKPSASLQYEYPGMAMSGSFAGRGGTLQNAPSASLHLQAPYRADVLSGKTPWFDSYEEYAKDIRSIAKEFTVIPEFRISEHMEYYLDNGFLADNNKFLDLVGSSLSNTSSAESELGALQPDFFKIYSHTDFMKHFSVIQEDHKKNNTAFASKIKLQANAVKKLLPYQGFYPVLRSVQLGNLFSSSYGPYISGSTVRDSDQERLAALYQPFFAPGIFFNTIKSGIAVNYSVHTGSAPEVAKQAQFQQANVYGMPHFVSSVYADKPNYSFPFEAIIDPDQYLPISSSLTSSGVNSLSSSVFFVSPGYTGSVNSLLGDPYYLDQTTDSPYLQVGKTQPQMFFEWKGQSSPKYSLAASNFFAESVNFFLEDSSLTSFVSKPEKDFKSMVSGSTYYMDVILYKTDDFVSYEGPASGTFNYDAGERWVATQPASTWNFLAVTLGDGLLNLGTSYRGMHYGPSYKSNGLPFGSTGTGSHPFASFHTQDPTYAPHTPPYFYGTSMARIAFKPHSARDMVSGEAAKFSLEEIISNAKVETEYTNENERSRTLQENEFRNKFPAGQAQMQISSSVNLFGSLTLKEIEYDTERNADGTFRAKSATTPSIQGTNDAWIVETKFECPSINMAHMDTASLGAGFGEGKEKYFTRGIWKGYGSTPTGSEGIYIQLKESYPQVLNDIAGTSNGNLTGSLIDVCGFKANKSRVGEIAGKKTISEAIVAIPIDEKGNFYPIKSDVFLKQKSNLDKNNKALMAGDFGVPNDIGETSITEMITKMKKFSIPPQMDFLNNPNIDPFVMYLFEFTHALDKKDLADIWQNLMPKISTVAERDSSTIEHPVGVSYEFFGQFKSGKLPSNIRWMVFKVKQKARNNYLNITKKSETSKGFTFTSNQELAGITSNADAELKFSYNWPYDFFSLVELAQIESEVTFTPPTSQVMSGSGGG